ncbi:hypothetical protein HDU76_004245 [Blyttiomyces sp. JEL0837]|nr:hypothetical protein HDU76_004245 [Blyttiomyces sp. JEL0837]
MGKFTRQPHLIPSGPTPTNNPYTQQQQQPPSTTTLGLDQPWSDYPTTASSQAVYLKSSISKPLIEGLSFVTMTRPKDPIEVLGRYLIEYDRRAVEARLAEEKEMRERRERIRMELMMERDNNNTGAMGGDMIGFGPRKTSTVGNIGGLSGGTGTGGRGDSAGIGGSDIGGSGLGPKGPELTKEEVQVMQSRFKQSNWKTVSGDETSAGITSSASQALLLKSDGSSFGIGTTSGIGGSSIVGVRGSSSVGLVTEEDGDVVENGGSIDVSMRTPGAVGSLSVTPSGRKPTVSKQKSVIVGDDGSTAEDTTENGATTTDDVVGEDDSTKPNISKVGSVVTMSRMSRAQTQGHADVTASSIRASRTIKSGNVETAGEVVEGIDATTAEGVQDIDDANTTDGIVADAVSSEEANPAVATTDDDDVVEGSGDEQPASIEQDVDAEPAIVNETEKVDGEVTGDAAVADSENNVGEDEAGDA